MEKLKKVISLNQASKISGYHSDYLSALIRKGEMKGEKIGGNWFTTEEEIKNYIFKQEVRHKKLAIRGFLSQKRIQNILFISGMLFLCIIVLGIYFYSKNNRTDLGEGKKTLSSEVETIN